MTISMVCASSPSVTSACIQGAFPYIQKSIKNYFEYFPSGPAEGLWTFHVSSIGHARIPKGHPYPPPRHPEGRAFTWQRGRILSAFQMVAISRGGGVLESREGAFPLRTGDVFLLPPGYWHRYRPDSLTGWTEEWVELRGPTIDAWLAGGLLEFRHQSLPAGHAFWRVFQELHGVCRSRPLGFRAIASGMAMTLVAIFSSVQASRAAGRGQELPDLARRARELLMEGREVGEVAGILGVSYPTLYRNFKKVTGLGPKDYARQIRLARAEDLLSGTTLSVKEIAARLGYFSASHLSLEFKKARGKSPAHWARRH